MRIANITTPYATHLQPAAADIRPGCSVVDVLTRVDVPLANDVIRLAMKDLVYVDAAVQAENAGCDAIFVNTVADYGLDLIRSAVSVPVSGAGEAGVRTAASIASRFSFVTVWPSSTKISYDRVLRATGTVDRCASVRYVLEEDELPGLGGGAAVMEAVTHEGSEIADRVLWSCEAAVGDGAEAIVLGCTCMTALTPFLRSRLSVPVVDPLREGYMAAEAAARAGATTGVAASAMATPDTLARVAAAVDAWSAMGASAPSHWADDCGTACAVVAESVFA